MRRNGIAGSLWKGAKAGYHHYRAGRLEQRARFHRERAVLNPRPTGIPGRVLEVRYHRAGKDPGRYVHRFGRNVAMRLGPGRSRVTLYHRRGEPIWADERARDFDRWVALDHRRRTMNPRRRRARVRRQDNTTMWLLLGGLGVYLWSTGQLSLGGAAAALPPGTVSTGGQPILPQSPGTLWYSDPYAGGDGSYFVSALPPGAAPPWRQASEVEAAALSTDLASGRLVSAGGGLYAANPAWYPVG